LISINTNSQVTFNKENYFNFLKNNDGMNLAQAEQLYPLAKTYYMGKENSLSPEVYDYYDTVKFKMSLTDDEILLLKRNGFVVTERKSYNRFLDAFDDIYYKDLPVFVSTDAILFALHSSYDNILKQMEVNLLEPNVILIASQMYNNVPSIIEKYKNIPELLKALHDIDLYITVAQSLITGTESNMHYPSDSSAHNILKLIKLQNPVQLKLFCDTFRYIDFSQFKPRGSYLGKFYKPSGKYETLENYFKTTMWLGRIDFWLTPPDSTWNKSDIKQMNFDALLLNELLDLSDSRKLLNENDKIISFLVGQSDNFTPTQIESTKENLNISDASALINDPTYSTWISNLKSTSVFGQRIMSDIIICDSTTDRPIVLPVSFKLFGQRFIIDSYVMANVVFDRVINKGKKEIRLMPSPLDVLFALGNNNALPMLQKDIDTYHYSLQLLAMRQLIDGYDNPFWHETLYNNWLQAIRQINPTADSSGLPFFMSSAAWQH